MYFFRKGWYYKMSLCRIEVITSLAKFSSLKSALSKAGVRGMTVIGSVFLNKRDKRNILKNLNFMVDKHNSQWYYNWAVANNCFQKNKQLKRISEKWNSQLTKDRRYDKVSKSSTKRQQNLNSKMFEKT